MAGNPNGSSHRGSVDTGDGLAARVGRKGSVSLFRYFLPEDIGVFES
jgi:hypothetical protein